MSATDSAGTAAVFELTSPDESLRLERQLSPSAMVERITVRSHARDAVDLELELRFDADFRPMLEVRGVVNPLPRQVRRDAHGHTLRFEATGLDGLKRATTIACPGAVAEDDGRLRVELTLQPGEQSTLVLLSQRIL